MTTVKPSKKKRTDSSKIHSVGSNTGNSLSGSKRCSTSHFGIPKSQQSSVFASKESSKRPSIASSTSKNSTNQLKQQP